MNHRKATKARPNDDYSTRQLRKLVRHWDACDIYSIGGNKGAAIHNLIANIKTHMEMMGRKNENQKPH